MFATLLGALPRPPIAFQAAPEAVLDACLALQTEHGLEPVTDGGWPVSDDVVGSWRVTAERADRLVKAIIVGPWTSRRPVADVRGDIAALADAGCRWIEVQEPVATSLAADDREHFANAHRDLTAGLGSGVHLSLAITGGSADAAGIDTILAGDYASLALDLINGPDNWRLAVAAPAEVGIICGAVSGRTGSDEGPEILLWAADYAASSRGRGMDRVGLATAGSLAALSWDEAATKVRRLSEAARLVTASREERLASIDPRAVDIRSHGPTGGPSNR
jgi:Cobalamin-independent synthase, N-terminal domain